MESSKVVDKHSVVPSPRDVDSAVLRARQLRCELAIRVVLELHHAGSHPALLALHYSDRHWLD